MQINLCVAAAAGLRMAEVRTGRSRGGTTADPTAQSRRHRFAVELRTGSGWSEAAGSGVRSECGAFGPRLKPSQARALFVSHGPRHGSDTLVVTVQQRIRASRCVRTVPEQAEMKSGPAWVPPGQGHNSTRARGGT